MKLLSVNVGLPREIEWQGKRVRTSIFKSALAGHVRVMTLNVEGDEQSDLSVHGGVHKAVSAYPSEHYPFWREEVPGVDLPLGTFGENFTSDGLFEEAVHIGDRFRVGSAEFIVTQPRLPCFKLGIRFEPGYLSFRNAGAPNIMATVITVSFRLSSASRVRRAFRRM
jgi:MOSC domain-containing protein YiiM